MERKRIEQQRKKQMISTTFLSALFALFLVAYLLVWLSGEFDNSQYADTYRVFVTGGLVLSYVALKRLEN